MGRLNAAWQIMRDAVSVPRPLPAAYSANFSAPAYQPVDLYGQYLKGSLNDLAGSVTRARALSVAAVQRARNQICSIATLPIHTYKGIDQDNDVHPLLRQVDPDVPNVVTFAETYEDLLFEGISWWLITAQDFDGYPVSARHVPYTSVSLTAPAGAKYNPLPSGINVGSPGPRYVWIDGIQTPASQVIRFDSPNPGMLNANARSIRRALLIDRLASSYANNPRPLDYFTDNPDFDGEEMQDDDVDAFLAEWADARRRSATAKVPSALTYHAGDSISPADMQLVQLGQQVTLEIANGAGIDPEDLGLNTTTRTYQNAQDRRLTKVNETYGPYIRAVTDRLSMGDVTRRGYDVRYDLTDYLKADIATLATVASTLKAAGIMTADEARPWFNLSGTAPQVAPAPDPVAPAADAGALVASSRPAAAFAGREHERFTAPSTAAFSVDVESRTIRGLAIPYGVPGVKYGTSYVFDGPGSAVKPPSGVVKHFDDHMSAIGRLTDWQERPDGIHAALSVMPGDDGDKLLAKAQHGVYDGLSAGIDWDGSDPVMSRDGSTVTFSAAHPATVREISTTAMPVFDSARVTSVAASATGGNPMKCRFCGLDHAENVACATFAAARSTPTPDPTPVPPTPAPADPTPDAPTDSRLDANGKWTDPNAPGPGTSAAFGRQVVDPTRPTAATMVREALPYSLSKKIKQGPFGVQVDWAVEPGNFDFGADLSAMSGANDQDGHTPAGRRVLDMIGHASKATFAGVASTDVTGLNPAIQRPDLYVDVPDFRYPIMQLISRGGPPNGIQPFTFPKFNSSASLVAAHTEGVEPAQGSFTVTTQTVTPSPNSGEVNVTRETIDMGGNPAAATLIFNKMVQAWNEALETNAATFLNTLTAATDISLNTGATAGSPPTSAQLFANWTAALSGLVFNRGYDFSAALLEQNLYQAFAMALDTTGRPLFPMVGAMNANGGAAPRFTSLDLGGVTGLPSWALTHTVGSLNNSWLFDPATVFAWNTQPQRLDFPGRKPSDGSYAPVAYVGMGIWGYQAFANTDVNGVRQVTYDTTT